MLKDFKGHLQIYGYTAYDFCKEEKNITVLHCMAHARRKFYDAIDNDKTRTEYALEQFAKLYAIERKAKQLDFIERLLLRKDEAMPIRQELGGWMKGEYIKVLPKSAIGQALGYSIERWDELMIYTTDGKLNIDNNPVENGIRPVAIGRKNYLFAGSHEAAQRSAMLFLYLAPANCMALIPLYGCGMYCSESPHIRSIK